MPSPVFYAVKALVRHPLKSSLYLTKYNEILVDFGLCFCNK
jgi:hypothetical protein